MQHTVVATQLNTNELTTHWYTTITVVHNIHSSAQHMHETEKHLGYLNVKLLQP